MSEGKKFVERTLTTDPNRFKSAPTSHSDANLSAYQKKIRRDQAKADAKRQERREQSAPYYKPPSYNVLSNNEELALVGSTNMKNNREIADVKSILDITPSKSVPVVDENTIIFTPAESRRSEMRELLESSKPSALNFDGDFDFGLDLDEKLEEKGGRKRRKSRKLRKSKKSRKSKRRTTRKVRRHR